MDGSNFHAFHETPFLYWHPVSRGDSRQQGQFTQSPRAAASMVPSQPTQAIPYSPVRATAQPMTLQANWAADGLVSPNRTGLSTPMASPRPMTTKPTIFLNDEATHQHTFKVEGAWEAYNVPSTPALSVSGSTISSPPSSCFSATGNDSTLFGDEPFEDFKHACDAELKSITLTVEDWSNDKCRSLTPVSEFAHVPIPPTPTTQPLDLLCINACPSLSPSPSPHLPAVSQSELDFCDPRLITVGSAASVFPADTASITFPPLPTLCAGDDEEHKLILGDELLTKSQSVFSDSPKHTFPSFENISELESEEDFAYNLASFEDPAQFNSHGQGVPAARQRSDFGLCEEDLVSEPSSDECDSAEHQFDNGLPSPPESTNPSRRGSEDSTVAMRTKRKMMSCKAGRSVVAGAEISETNFHEGTPSMLSTASEQTSGKSSTHRQQTSSAQAQTPSASQSQSTSPAASAPSAPPSSANRRGRKQSLTEDPSKTFVCDLCSRRFRRQEHLKRHYRSLHTLEKPFECNECGKKFSRSDNLAQHARTHGSGAIVMSFLGEEEMASDEQVESAGDEMAHELGYALYEAVHDAAGSTTTTSSVEGSLREDESPSPDDEDQPRKKRKTI